MNQRIHALQWHVCWMKNGPLNGSFIDSFEWNLCWKKIKQKSLSPRPYPRIINVEFPGILWASGWFWWIVRVETRWPPQSSCPMWPLPWVPALRAPPSVSGVPHTDILGHLSWNVTELVTILWSVHLLILASLPAGFPGGLLSQWMVLFCIARAFS